uniref:GRHL1/CP2 C-terminal domain-containing protein n=1 Tax=Oncorhynchus kisutch TaxID=8019 RepID=A0A8C7FPJ8_ONCKI
CIQLCLTIYVCQQHARNQPQTKPGGGGVKVGSLPPMSTIYNALYLDDLPLGDLSEKIALLYNVTPQQISHIYRQGPTGIHMLVSDEVRKYGSRVVLFLFIYETISKNKHI